MKKIIDLRNNPIKCHLSKVKAIYGDHLVYTDYGLSLIKEDTKRFPTYVHILVIYK